VAESKQFGSPKVLQFGDKTAGNRSGDAGHCAQCEAMLTDALDGTLSAADQELFDNHMAVCGACSQLLADARRGAAWLEILRKPAPEPPAALLERILAETSGAAGHAAPSAMQHAGIAAPVPVPIAGDVAAIVPGIAYANVLPFPRRFAAAMRRSSIGQVLLQPRLAMTAAMAFFSVGLTMNLTGVRLQDLRASDLSPSSLKRDFYSANTRVVQYYEGLRVVYELESRVHDMQSAQDVDAPAGSQSTAPSAAQPGSQTPAAQPAPANQKAAPQPGSKQPEQRKPAPSPGSSRREEPFPSRRLLVAATRDGISGGRQDQASEERKLV